MLSYNKTPSTLLHSLQEPTPCTTTTLQETANQLCNCMQLRIHPECLTGTCARVCSLYTSTTAIRLTRNKGLPCCCALIGVHPVSSNSKHWMQPAHGNIGCNQHTAEDVHAKWQLNSRYTRTDKHPEGTPPARCDMMMYTKSSRSSHSCVLGHNQSGLYTHVTQQFTAFTAAMHARNDQKQAGS